jgi:hypothetical protein
MAGHVVVSAAQLSVSMIFSENRYPPSIKCGAGFFGIMLEITREARVGVNRLMIL